MTIREATLADLDAVLDCWQSLLVNQIEYGSLLHPTDNDEAGRRLLAEAITEGRVLVATEGEAVAGIAVVRVDRGVLTLRADRGVIDTLFVCSWARGQGIGTELLLAAEETLTERGCEIVTVEALAANERGRSFYEKNGYEPHRIVFQREVETNTKERDER